VSIYIHLLQAAKILGPPTTFNAAKLKVEFAGEELRPPFPRAYTLTHCDLTANLTLGVMSSEQLRKSTLQRDDVVAEWKETAGEMTLQVHCFVSGANLLQELAAGFRYYVFSKELPLVRAFQLTNFNLIDSRLMIDGSGLMHQGPQGGGSWRRRSVRRQAGADGGQGVGALPLQLSQVQPVRVLGPALGGCHNYQEEPPPAGAGPTAERHHQEEDYL
jgi:hypothetical protein